MNDPLKNAIRIYRKKFNSSNFRSGSKGTNFFGVVTILGALSGLVYNSFYMVPAGHVSIKFNRFTGVGNQLYGEGLKFMIPAIERPIIYDARIRPTEISSSTGSMDLQNVKSTVRIIHKPYVSNLQTLYRDLGYDYAERILPSIVNEVMKSVIATFNAEELLTKRSKVTTDIGGQIKKEALKYNIVIEDVSILNLGFGKEYSKAVEDKQVAKQESERAKYEVMKATHEKESKIVTAQGEAKAIKIVGEQMRKSDGYIALRRIQTAREIADIISNAQNRIYLNSDSLLVNLDGDLLKTDRH